MGEELMVPGADSGDSPADSAGGSTKPGVNFGELPGLAHREFLERALSAAGEWTRYADPKALGVLVVLGLGVKDLVDHGGRFIHPHEARSASCGLFNAAGHTCQGIAATVVFAAACALAMAVVAFVTHALFSRMTFKRLLGQETDQPGPRSRFFFGEVRRHGSQEAYTQDVLAETPYELLRDVAGQVYEVSKVCHAKHLATQRAYIFVLLFLVAWVTARVLLSTVA